MFAMDVVLTRVCAIGKIFKDTAGKQLVATIKAGGADARFNPVNLGNGVIVCQ
jgi:hypothetical protein